jgi:hypothetical protein
MAKSDAKPNKLELVHMYIHLCMFSSFYAVESNFVVVLDDFLLLFFHLVQYFDRFFNTSF